MSAMPAANAPWACAALRPGASPRREAGFTLIEILLALTILGLLLSVAAINFGAFRNNQALEEGASRLETALRMARAEAANQGRRIRIAFSEEDGRVQVLWEPEPLAEPGVFVPCTSCTWDDYLTVEGVRLDRCQLVGTSIHRPSDWADGGGAPAESVLDAITFEPDGSSDSAVIELLPTDVSDLRRAVIGIDGMTGIITSRILTSEEIAGQ
jgi:prepilin-type N-terminal cleavage/methylation domain-containing protein